MGPRPAPVVRLEGPLTHHRLHNHAVGRNSYSSRTPWESSRTSPLDRRRVGPCRKGSTERLLSSVHTVRAGGLEGQTREVLPRKLSSTSPTDCSARPTWTVCPRTPISAFCNLSSADRQGVHPVHHGKHDRLWSCPAGSEEHATRRYCGGSSVLRTHGQGKRPHGTIRDLSESRTMPKVAHRLWINMWTMGPYRGSFRGGG
jgi:hypothetical protein